MRSMLLLLLLTVFSSSVRADELYAFSFTPTDTLSGTQISSFSFSFTVPSFVVAGGTPGITPFNITDGTNSWTITQALAGNNTRDCFLFASAGLSLHGSTCGAGSTANGDAFLRFDAGVFVYPTGPGTYSDGGVIEALTTGGRDDITGGDWSLVVTDVSSVPEPSSLILLGSGLAGLAGVIRRKLNR